MRDKSYSPTGVRTVRLAVSARAAAGDNNNGRVNRTTPALWRETIVVIECLDGVVLVFIEAFIAAVGPYSDELGLRALMTDLAR